MSELSDISIENPAVGDSSTDNTMTRDVAEKVSTSSSFSERVKEHFWKIFNVYHGNGNRRCSPHPGRG